jgi:hypothetical protein
MGFDLMGVNAKSKTGEYFRNNIWWWRALANYVVNETNTPEPDSWFSNDGYEVPEAEAVRIADILDEKLASGEVRKFSVQYVKNMRKLPKEPCDFCGQTGKRGGMVCNGCGGKGVRKPFIANYPFHVRNVREFAKFARASGGFRIC